MQHPVFPVSKVGGGWNIQVHTLKDQWATTYASREDFDNWIPDEITRRLYLISQCLIKNYDTYEV